MQPARYEAPETIEAATALLASEDEALQIRAAGVQESPLQIRAIRKSDGTVALDVSANLG